MWSIKDVVLRYDGSDNVRVICEDGSEIIRCVNDASLCLREDASYVELVPSDGSIEFRAIGYLVCFFIEILLSGTDSSAWLYVEFWVSVKGSEEFAI